MKYKEVRFFHPLTNTYNFHFYLMQFVGSLYMIYRLLSRDYSYLGLFDHKENSYFRSLFHEYFPIPLSYLTTFQFIYDLFPFLNNSTNNILFLEYSIIISSTLVLIGVLPRIFSIISFLFYLHIIGLMQAFDAELDGGTILLLLFFILSLSPSSYFYKFNNFDVKKTILNWPMHLLFVGVGSFYSFSGLNKILDTGIFWPFNLDFEKWNQFATEKSLFLYNRQYYANITSSPILQSPFFSDISGVIALIAEIGFITILFLPRYRLFCIFSMIIMHVLIYYTHAINFLGSSIILMLCFDWNLLVRKITLYYDQDCGFCKKSLTIIQKYDIFKLLDLVPSHEAINSDNKLDINRLNNEMGAVDENSEIYYGADAFEQAFSRIPVYWPIAILMKIPFMIYISRFFYRIIAKNRHKLTKEGCDI